MYHIHLTKAFVINKQSTKDDDASIIFLTEDFGLIRAYTYGLRKMKSKLRFTFQIGNHCEVALVRGKAGWQVTNGILLEEKITTLETIQSLHRLGVIIQKVVPYEEVTKGYFVYGGLKDVLVSETHHEESKQAALYVAVLNILSSAGYGIDFFGEEMLPYTEVTFQYILKNQLRVNKEIKKALNASQL